MSVQQRDEGDEWGDGVEAEAAVADQPDAAVEALETAVGEPEADGGEDAGAVAADRLGEADERLKARPGCPRQPRVEVLGRERWVVEVIEQAQFLLEQEGAVQRAVGVLDFTEQRELIYGLLGRRLEQGPAGALDPAPARRLGALVGVPLVAAHLVCGTLAEANHMEGVKADLGVGDVSRTEFHGRVTWIRR